MQESREIKDLCCNIPVLQAKFIIDAVNCLDVTQDHIRVQASRQSFFNRMCDSFTGAGNRRQAQINARIRESLEGMVLWMQSLASSQTEIAHALTHAVARLKDIENNVAKLAEYSCENRIFIGNLRQDMERGLKSLGDEVQRLDLTQRAQLQMDRVLSQWKVGDFEGVSLAGQCCIVLETLFYGPFGECCHLHSEARGELLSTVVNESIHILKDKAKWDETLPRPAMEFWLQHHTQAFSPLHGEALSYLGDWATRDKHPYTFAVINGGSDSIQLPRACDSKKLAKALQGERFTACTEVSQSQSSRSHT